MLHVCSTTTTVLYTPRVLVAAWNLCDVICRIQVSHPSQVNLHQPPTAQQNNTPEVYSITHQVLIIIILLLHYFINDLSERREGRGTPTIKTFLQYGWRWNGKAPGSGIIKSSFYYVSKKLPAAPPLLVFFVAHVSCCCCCCGCFSPFA